MRLHESSIFFSHHLKRGIFIFLIIFSIIIPSSYKLIPDLYPETGKKNISVKIEYKGAYEKDIEKLINKLEQPLSSIHGLRSVYSVSEEEKGIIYCSFSDSINYDDVYEEVRDCVNRVYTVFPENVQRPVLSKSGIDNYPVFAASFPLSENSSFSSFRDSKTLKKIFEDIPGCAEIEIGGFIDEEIIVIPDSEKIISSPLKFSDIINRIREENFSSVITPPGRIQIKTGKRIRKADDINQIFLKKNLSLSDYASAAVWEKKRESSGKIDGEKTLILYAVKEGDFKTINVCRLLQKKTIKLKGSVIFNRGEEIEKALSETAFSVAAGVAAVIISALIYFRYFSISILVILNILFSILSSAASLKLAECRLDIISLSGMAVVSGLAIDNSIILLERFKFSDADIRAAIDETFYPLLFSLLTTSAVFIPLIFASEKLIVMFKGMAVSVTSGLTASFIFTFYFIPLFLHKKNFVRELSNNRHRIFFTNNRVFKILKILSIRKNISGLLIFITISTSFILILNTDYKPFIFRSINRITFFMEFPAGTRFKYVEKAAYSVEKSILKDKTLSLSLKVEKERARFDIRGISEKSLKITEDKIRKISSVYKNIYFYFPGSESLMRRYDINIYSRDIKSAALDAYRLGEEIKSKYPVLEVLHHFKAPSEGLNVIINTVKTNNITASELSRYIYTTLSKPVISKYFSAETERDIRFGPERTYTLEEIRELPVSAGNGSVSDKKYTGMEGWKYLKDIAELKRDSPPNRIYHRNRQRLVSLSVSGEKLVPSSIEKILSSFNFSSGCRGEGGNDYREERAERKELIFLIVLSFFFIFTVLVVQFESFRIPVLILTGIPSSFTLPLFIMKIFQIPFSISTSLALILSAGICVNNAILILSPYKGQDIITLSDISASLSLKGGAMLTASFTTLLSILPLIFTGTSGILAPFSIILASGITGALITLPLVLASSCIKENQE